MRRTRSRCERLRTEFKGKVEVLQLPAAGAARTQEAGGRGGQGRIREDPHGPEGARVLHEVPGAGGPVGPRRRRRLPSARRRDEEDSVTSERRRFLRAAGGTMAAVAAAAVADAANVIAQPKVQWRMSTAWPPALDVLQGSARRLGKIVEEMSGGRFRIEVFAGRADHAGLRLLRGRLPGHHRGLHGGAVLLGGEGARDRVVPERPVRHEPRGHGGLVLPGRRAQAVGGDVRPVQPRAAPGPGVRPADGRMVPEEDQRGRRLQGTQDAHRRGPRKQGRRPGRAARPSSFRPPGSTRRSSGA